MSNAIVGRWGRNLAVRLPDAVAAAAGISEGERVEIDTEDGAVVIRRVAPRFTAEDLFRGKSPAEWRREYAQAFDWGPDVGREVVEE